MHSAIYQGWVRHRRFSPKAHAFRYQVFMVYLDLDEIEQVMAMHPWWSSHRLAPVRFKRSDYMGDPNVPLKQAVLDCVQQQLGFRPDGAVRMLANLRCFGYCMNPISCYYCFDQAGDLQAIVADVHNTPWGERTAYALPCDPSKNTQRIFFNKAMHVSPFNPLAMQYDWRSTKPDQKVALTIAVSETGTPSCNELGDQASSHSNKIMDATIVMEKTAMTKSNMGAVIRRFPWMTAKVIAAIYWQALKLWLKRVPLYDHPDKSNQQTA
jgi:hypothetical protein